MNSNAEGMCIASVCLLNGLVGFLISKQLIHPSDVATITGDAEEMLAGLKPELMSADAREYARRILQEGGKIFGQMGKRHPD
jgi:hypothetical protein